MMKFLCTLLIAVTSLHAKEVYFADAEGVKTSETVDPSLKLWYLKDYVFRMQGIDQKQFVLGIKTSKGFDRPNVEESLENFGESASGPVLFYIVPIDERGKLSKLTTITSPSEAKPDCNCPTAAPSVQLPAPPPTPTLSAAQVPVAPATLPPATPPAPIATPPAPTATPPAPIASPEAPATLPPVPAAVPAAAAIVPTTTVVTPTPPLVLPLK